MKNRKQQKNRRPAQAKPSKNSTFTVEGFSSVSEYLKFRPEAVLEVFCKEQELRKTEVLLKGTGIKLECRDRERSEKTSPVWATVRLSLKDFSDFAERVEGRDKDLVIALDHITDPRNLGAIVRSAAFFGVKEILIPTRRQVLLTQAAVSTAQGGFALTDLVGVTNLNRSLGELKELGYWAVGAAMDGESCSDLVGFYDKMVLVLGAEDTGISRIVADSCDRMVAISGSPDGDGLESLNVSVAAGILISLFRAN